MSVQIILIGAHLVMHEGAQVFDLVRKIRNVLQQVGLASSCIPITRELAHLAWHVILENVGNGVYNFLGRSCLDGVRADPRLANPFEAP